MQFFGSLKIQRKDKKRRYRGFNELPRRHISTPSDLQTNQWKCPGGLSSIGLTFHHLRLFEMMTIGPATWCIQFILV